MNASKRIPGRRFLHSPGPMPVPDEVLHAMSRQPLDMGDPRVDAVIEGNTPSLSGRHTPPPVHPHPRGEHVADTP